MYGAGPGGPGGPAARVAPVVLAARAVVGPAGRGPEGQAQGRLVAALDVEEGARRHRRRVRGVHHRPRRRLLLPGERPTIPTAFAANVNDQSTTVYYSDGHTVLGTIGTVDRQDLTINQIPKGLQDAVVSAEDRGFWTEGGISPTGILRAAYEDVTGSGASPQGGSTITQEFVRNYYDAVGTQQTISRKIKEIFIAQKLASSKSKDWILQNYMNVIYLGDGSYGVEAAPETYFGEPVIQADRRPGRGHRGDHPGAVHLLPAAVPDQPQEPLALRARGMVKIGDLSQAQADP